MAVKRINSLIPKASRQALYRYLIEEGTIVVRKSPTLPKHDSTQIQNLHVMMMMKSLRSKGYVTEHYAWGYFYYILTAEGIDFLHEELGLPENIMPKTYSSTTGAGVRVEQVAR